MATAVHNLYKFDSVNYAYFIGKIASTERVGCLCDLFNCIPICTLQSRSGNVFQHDSATPFISATFPPADGKAVVLYGHFGFCFRIDLASDRHVAQYR